MYLPMTMISRRDGDIERRIPTLIGIPRFLYTRQGYGQLTQAEILSKGISEAMSIYSQDHYLLDACKLFERGIDFGLYACIGPNAG